jgi:malate dehydrogenase (oxaloacetate-decarboxylating)
MDLKEKALKLHFDNKGKLGINSKVKLDNKDDLSLAYTPGVGAVCTAISEDKSKVFDYTFKKNVVAVVSDGSAVLGLGNIGAEASLPVMEGKCIIFKKFAGLDAFPICIRTQDENEIIEIVKNISPTFGAVNLEDISAPRCYHIEQALQDIGIPVMHDDQHATAIVVFAALINAAKVVGKKIEDLVVVVNGAGAAGSATIKMLLCIQIDKNVCTAVKDVLVCDSKGLLYKGRENMDEYKGYLAEVTNKGGKKGALKDAVKGADVFIGVSKSKILTREMVKTMNDKPIIFAMANPVPEIYPNEIEDIAGVVGTGRSDLKNQINNSLVFPGVFKGAIEANAKVINNEMKIAAAHALAKLVKNPTKDKVITDMFDKNLTKNVSEAVKKAAIETKATR